MNNNRASNSPVLTSEPVFRKFSNNLMAIPPAYIGLTIAFIAAFFWRPMLLSPMLFLLVLRQTAPLGLIAVGQSLVMRARSVDLSVGGVLVMVNYLITSEYLPINQPWILIGVPILAGLAVGLVNGMFIALVRASAVIVTLAMSIMLLGAVLFFSTGRPPGQVPDIVRLVGDGRISGLPTALIVWALLAAMLAIFVRFSIFGKALNAAGDNPKATQFAGLPFTSLIITAHCLSGLMSAIAGVLLAGFVGVGSTTIGQDNVLNSIAAVILGGVTFGAGRGGVIGPSAGAFFIVFLFNLLTSFGMGASGKLMVQGAIIAFAALVFSIKSTRN